MGTVYSAASVSLDGFISGPGETGFDHLFRWYTSGENEVRTTHPELTFQLTETSSAYLRSLTGATGALVVGRRLFDLTDGWGGSHPLDRPVVVVTHAAPDGWPREDAPFTFVTDGVAEAVRQAKVIAGEQNVAVNGGTIVSQCLNAGLVDDLYLDLVPVLLGGGVPFFAQLADAPISLDGPDVVEDTAVTHLHYRVRRAGS
ncbi:MAG TPA: dihydrofolate reductase family protein [Pseudonocardiaceae bacterium]|nr:dihydrofolate reductase family protein [Pseudonocardiaceae bacterium]